MSKNSPVIDSFYDLMDEITYSWNPSKRMVLKDELYIIDKLVIGRDFVQYKDSYYRLAPGLYEKVETFFNLLEPKC